jgi:hypothetical protein
MLDLNLFRQINLLERIVLQLQATFPTLQTYLIVSIVLEVAAIAVAVVYLVRRKKRPRP